ncbi:MULTISPECIES: GTP cyclohydrolase I FolE [unclassified Nocardioides]|uniref:GTP cyclohydrolase I FolE n=1 Tax=Nocardioides sp. (strain ATCC BAA-499 / JS614) TaxID=196162 RepID=UPI0000EB6012|nr:GTP cyclohydrolase [Nocardioides sp. JS614]
MTSTAAISTDRATGPAVDQVAARRWRPRVTHPGPEIDAGAAEQAAADLLTALGLDLTDENLTETPRRMAQALIEMTSGADFALTTFPNDEGYDELVLVRDIPLQSVCEHHMLPFVGIAHIGYLPGDRILGLSKFARMVDLHARRPQTQERLTKRIADHLQEALQPHGVGVVIEAEHTCMSLRGARAAGARTTTSALFGRLRDDPRSRAEFLALTRSTP